MKKVAITGNIGSGKSWVCQLFESLGIPVFYSDSEAKRLYGRPDIRSAMTLRFGAETYLPDGSLNKPYLSSLIFSDASAMAEVERILYPALNLWFDDWAEAQDAPYVLYESAIVFEKHLEGRFDAVVMVTASEATRLRRVLLRDRCDEAAVRRRMALQWPDDLKCALADFVILHDHDDEDEALMRQVGSVHHQLCRSGMGFMDGK
ncbi:MAG: dephospho-CoA kinase [Bacteroidales bacterium]|nr:dephospho-CoA kinase [Bacteroidales bacterium]